MQATRSLSCSSRQAHEMFDRYLCSQSSQEGEQS